MKFWAISNFLLQSLYDGCWGQQLVSSNLDETPPNAKVITKLRWQIISVNRHRFSDHSREFLCLINGFVASSSQHLCCYQTLPVLVIRPLASLLPGHRLQINTGPL